MKNNVETIMIIFIQICELNPEFYGIGRLGYRGWRGTRYRDNDELKAAEEAWLGDQPDNFYIKGKYCLKESGSNALK